MDTAERRRRYALSPRGKRKRAVAWLAVARGTVTKLGAASRGDVKFANTGQPAARARVYRQIVGGRHHRREPIRFPSAHEGLPDLRSAAVPFSRPRRHPQREPAPPAPWRAPEPASGTALPGCASSAAGAGTGPTGRRASAVGAKGRTSSERRQKRCTNEEDCGGVRKWYCSNQAVLLGRKQDSH